MTPRLTVDDVRHHAEEVRDLAQAEVRKITDTKATQAAIVGVVVVVGLMSLAYYMGRRAGVYGPYDA